MPMKKTVKKTVKKTAEKPLSKEELENILEEGRKI